MTKELPAAFTETSPPMRSVTWPLESLAARRFGINRGVYRARDLAVAIDGDRLADVKFHPQSRQTIAADNHGRGKVHGHRGLRGGAGGGAERAVDRAQGRRSGGHIHVRNHRARQRKCSAVVSVGGNGAKRQRRPQAQEDGRNPPLWPWTDTCGESLLPFRVIELMVTSKPTTEASGASSPVTNTAAADCEEDGLPRTSRMTSRSSLPTWKAQARV